MIFLFPATEIRCEEKSKGGIKYDVILAEPAGTPPPLKTAADTPVILRSESIEEKLKQAEERRLVSLIGIFVVLSSLRLFCYV
jgi:hypothetical protein